MTKEKNFKAKVRARMADTGESFAAARRILNSKRVAVPSATTDDPWYLKCVEGWGAMVRSLDGSHWTNPRQIIEVLTEAGRVPNHKLLPGGGGLDLSGAAKSHEPGCIELHCDGSVDVVRPFELVLQKFDSDPLDEWAFLWLELDDLAPTTVYSDHAFRCEELTEDGLASYVGREIWDEGAYTDGSPLSDSARVVTRRFGGAILVVAKGAGWNTVDRYFGEHDQLGRHDFTKGLSALISQLQETGNYGKPSREWV